MSGVALVVGEGALAELVFEELAVRYEVSRKNDLSSGIPEGIQLAVVVSDDWQPGAYLQAEERMRLAGIPWISGFVTEGEGVVGPFVRPGKPGCSKCSDMRRMMARPNSPAMLERLMNRLLSPGGETVPPKGPSRMGHLHMASLLGAGADRILQGEGLNLEAQVYLIQLNTLVTSLHSFLPDPLCPVCSRLPDDSPEAARIVLKPNPKKDPDQYRIRSMAELAPVLAKNYVDARTGLFNDKWHLLVSPFTNVSINLPTAMGNEVTGGRSHSYAESELTAILEGLERYCGMTPRGKRTVIRDSYRNLADRALDPSQVGIYSNEQYALPDFPFEPFDPDHEIEWVWGYSFGQERAILVPQQLAYYSWGYEKEIVKETSNGCAIGGSMEEAVLHGILEVVERDSFLMTWYAKLPVPRVDPMSAQDPALRLMLERMRTIVGYEVSLYNTTMEHGIPSVWAVARNLNPSGPNLVCAAGAHLDPIKAVIGAIHELSNALLMINGKGEDDPEALKAMYEDPNLVEQLEDHSMLYAWPPAEERLRFLMEDNRPPISFAESFKPMGRHTDLTDDLKEVLQSFRRLNLDVIVVDQSSPETLLNGLVCVKVLIPGMLPMTFGHQLARVTGLTRLFRVPAELDYKNGPHSADQLNPHPHPFP